ncbi:MAG: hypothetical protein ACKVT0_23715 [Planctomycetaceae bacterium]
MSANSLCDGVTIRTEKSNENGYFNITVHSEEVPQWLPRPTRIDDVRELVAMPRTIVELIKGKIQYGRKGSVFYGHIEVHMNTIVFSPDKSDEASKKR